MRAVTGAWMHERCDWRPRVVTALPVSGRECAPDSASALRWHVARGVRRLWSKHGCVRPDCVRWMVYQHYTM